MLKQRCKGYIASSLAALCLLAVSLAGCGGGSGGGSFVAAPDTVNGTVTNNGTSTAGDVVKFDNLPGVTGTVGNGGTYTLTVPAADVTGSDNLWILDSSGNVLDVTPIVVPAGGGNTLTPSTALPAVPDPPDCSFAVGNAQPHC